jgi:hypothetical protein
MTITARFDTPYCNGIYLSLMLEGGRVHLAAHSRT